jgi:protein phosphatase
VGIALRYAARSDVGLVRSNNQDSAYAGPHLLVVADGMGGHAGGDVASSVAIAALAPLDGESHGPDDALDELERALEEAREEIISRSESNPELAGMGTTVTAILRAGNKLAMVHLGDSRGYLLRDGVLTQVTTDHTFVQHLVNTGKITPEEAETHPQRSVVMRVLGDFDVDIAPDLSVREARAGDRWLLCSDGLSGFVSGETIARTLYELPDVDTCAERLVQPAPPSCPARPAPPAGAWPWWTTPTTRRTTRTSAARAGGAGSAASC